MPITHDPATWPSGDRLWKICHAIAIAEGYDQEGSNPHRLNNPGDISDWVKTYGSEFHTGSNITHFPTPELGWEKLRGKLQDIMDGHSHVFTPGMTWYEIAKHWAPPNWQIWGDNVSLSLNVDPNSTLEAFMHDKPKA